jgi:phage shock protein PspC (stress-responsive transcriptional regulator)
MLLGAAEPHDGAMTENDSASTPGPTGADTTTGSTSAGGTTTAPPPYAPPPYAPPPGTPPRAPLRRSAYDRKIAGVAGGLGRYFGVDPLIFRVVLVTLAIFGGSGLLLYAVGWLLVPEDGEQESEGARLLNGRATGKVAGGIILAIVGLVVVGNFAHTRLGFGGFAALVAVAVAAYLLSRDGNRPIVSPRGPAPPPPGAPGAYGQTTGTAYAGVPPTSTTGAPYVGSGAAPSYPQPAPWGAGRPPGGPPSAPPGWYPLPPPAAPKASEPRSPLGRITASVAVLVAGILVTETVATTHNFSAEVVLAACLGVVGLGLVISAFVGRGRGLIILGGFLAVATTAASFNPVGFRGGVGDRVWHPRTVAAVADHSPYRLGVGDGRLDLSDLDLSAGQPVRVEARIGIGQLTITVPTEASVRVVGDVRAGTIRVLSAAQQDGTDVHEDVQDPVEATSPQITIDVEMGVGDLEVDRATS